VEVAIGDPLGSPDRRCQVTRTRIKQPQHALAAALGHRFDDPSLLSRALTHGSADASGTATDYQRLEFLGDRVLGLLIAELLFRYYPHATEGELATRFNAHVRREALAEVARELDLGEHLVLGQGEAQAGGRDKDAILADSCEALIAALYLDGGLPAARALVERLWAERVSAQDAVPRDPKTQLQEWSQSKGHGLPDYVETTRQGPPHAPVFTVEVRVGTREPAIGHGRSKREAEREAAAALLAREGIG
jgi:ribonuclease-3